MDNSIIFIALLKYVNKSLKQIKDKQFEILVSTAYSDSKNESQYESLLVLPSFKNDSKENNIRNSVLNTIQELTAKTDKKSGLKAKRIIEGGNKFVNVNSLDSSIRLFVVPLLTNLEIEAPSKVKFLNLSAFSSHIDLNLDLYSKELCCAIKLLQNWIKKKCSKVLLLQAIFKPLPLDRIKCNITNSAYSSELNHDWVLLQNKLSAAGAMEKLKLTNRSNFVVYNPLFGNEVDKQSSANCIVRNKYFGGQIPDYSKIMLPLKENWLDGQHTVSGANKLSWEEEFPIHKAAAYGDVSLLESVVSLDLSCLDSFDKEGWAPIHYSCWYGHVDSVKLLLEIGCDPNLCNKNKTSLLHLAAGCGHHKVLKILSEHPLIDKHIKDGRNRTPMECCEKVKSKDWQKCMVVLKDLNSRPLPQLVIHSMDGSEKTVEIKHGSNTKVNDILHMFNLSDARQYFSLWITSKSLHLQLKEDHSPLVEIDNWTNTLFHLTGLQWSQCVIEQPRLVLKRDVKLLPNVEECVTDIFAIRLLYEEAHAQLLRGLYISTDQVVVAMAAISIRILYGPYSIKKPKIAFFEDEVLRQVLPTCKILNRSINWPQRLLTEYREISQQGPGEVSQLQLLYLRYCWTQIPTYGCAFFTGFAYATRQDGEEKIQKVIPLYIGVNYRGIHFVKVENKVLLVSVNYLKLKWHLKESEDIFQIKTMDEKINMIIHTSQAAFVCSLMTKLKHNLKKA